jgi:peptidoglycan/LPS O-acetylase OafA/YrhL
LCCQDRAMSRGVAIPRVRALDGLRGTAVAGVLLFHGGHLTGGYLGVDLFFVLSGFLITSLLLAESDSKGSVALGGFWARRARRLLPALAGLMVGIAVYCVVFAAPTELNQIRGDALATLGYIANWRAVAATQDYWALFRAPSPLQHTWSLAIEEQFYLVWPLVFVGLLLWWKHATAKAVLVTALIAAAISSALMVILYNPANTNRVYYGTDTRAAAILLGVAFAAALAEWGPIRGRSGRWLLEIAGILGVVILAIAWTRLSGQSATLYRGGFLLCGLATVAVMAAAAHPEAGPISRAFSFRPLCLLGLISYGVYLWHWPVYVVATEARTGLSGWALVGVRVALTLVIAIASFFIIEQPVRRGAITPRTWRGAIPAIAALLVAMIFVTTTDAKPGPSAASTRPDSFTTALREASAHPGATRVLVVGNSVAYDLAVELKPLKTTPKIVVFNDAVVACSFPWGVLPASVSAHNFGNPKCDTGWGKIVQGFRPDVVLFVEQCCKDEYRIGSKWMQPCDTAYVPMYRRVLAGAARTLRQSGARLVITTVPYGSAELFNATAQRNLDCSNQLRVQEAERLKLQVVDLFQWTCPHGHCRERQDGVVLRPDLTHFTGAGAQIVDRWLLEQAHVTKRTARPTANHQ